MVLKTLLPYLSGPYFSHAPSGYSDLIGLRSRSSLSFQQILGKFIQEISRSCSSAIVIATAEFSNMVRISLPLFAGARSACLCSVTSHKFQELQRHCLRSRAAGPYLYQPAVCRPPEAAVR